jgi:hypothetical protein
MNDAYCRNISVNTRSVLNTKRSNGEYVGACPVYGYRKSDNNKNVLAIDDYPASVVKDIFKMKLGGYSAARIADTLNSGGVLSPIEYKKDRGLPYPKNGYADKDGAKWSAHTIIRILQDETYTGTLIQGKVSTPNYNLKEVQRKPESEWHRRENAHPAIVSFADFELVQRLMQLDTRTAPNGDSIYVFSGLLICGCCGNRMIRKSAPGNGKRYYNYWCPTTKKGGCLHSVMMKEDELTACVLDSVKAHIANVASLETLLTNLDSEKIGRELAAKLTEQTNENEHRLDKIREFKAGLYENMISGNLSKEEHKALKSKYNGDADILIAANERLYREIDDALSCKHERLAWLGYFKQFANLDVIDRKTVAILIKYIKIIGKREIEIEFNYQSEYDKAVALIRKEAA